MSQTAESTSGTWTAVDLAARFGPIPLDRIRSDPPPGRATERDVVAIHDRENRLYELVDGVLVEKTMGLYESYLAANLVQLLGRFVTGHDLGIVLAPDGMMRLAPRLVRIPDVSFIAWGKLPGRQIPTDPIPDLVPDLAVEVISRGNTRREMSDKLTEYFQHGVRGVWFVHWRSRRRVRVFRSPMDHTTFPEDGTIDGGEILPGLTLPVRWIFSPPTGTVEKTSL